MNNTDPLRRIVEDRVEELLRFRSWYRQHRAINLDTIEAIHTAELRVLVRLLRTARLQEKADRVARIPADWPVTEAVLLGLPEQADPVTAAKGYWDWVSGR